MAAIDASEMTARVDDVLARHPAVGFALGVVQDGRLESFDARGVAHIPSGTPITEDTVFRIASISKTFTAIAVMQLWERGLIDLEAPANEYLRAYRLVPAKASYRPATVRHLLTHTAGIGEVARPWHAVMRDFGESFELGQAPTLAEYYGDGLRIGAQPGTRFRYGDHGIATLGQIIEDVSATPFDRYLRERIFEPLGMASTDLLRSEGIKARLATGYTLGSRGPRPVADREWVTAGAASIYSTPRDMARYVAALMGGGANAHGSMLEPATMAAMFEPQYRSDPRLPGIGLSFFRADLGGHLAVEHQGTLPGFDSQIYVAPEDGIGVLAFTNGARLAPMWLPPELARLLRRLIGVADEGIRTDLPHHPEIWGDLCGWYGLPAELTDVRMRSSCGLGAEVYVRGGRLMVGMGPIPGLLKGFPLHPDDPDDPYAFRIDFSEMGGSTVRILFSRDAAGAVTRLHWDLLCTVFEKQPGFKDPRLWIKGGLAALGIGTAASVLRRRRTAPKAVGRAG